MSWMHTYNMKLFAQLAEVGAEERDLGDGGLHSVLEHVPLSR